MTFLYSKVGKESKGRWMSSLMVALPGGGV